MPIRCGTAVLVTLLIASVFAAPSLTTIEDVLYKADGSKFNGVAFVEWRSFQAADFSVIATHSVTVPIVDGLLRVRLAPTTNATPGAYYSVRYHSNGRIQFDEIWAVPPSEKVLHLRDVRVPSATQGGQVAPPQEQTEILESDVVGLVDDLAARPLMGPGYTPSRAAAINDMGELEAVAGSLTDCVRVDGTAGPCSGPGFIDAESPAGIIDGSNTTFLLSEAPSPPLSLALFRNGVLQKDGLDYTVSNNVIEFGPASIPQAGDALTASYRLADAGTPAGTAHVPQVLCSSVGSSTSSPNTTSLGTCAITAGSLAPGDRVEVMFQFSHEGASRGFTYELGWGSTTILSRSGLSSETRTNGVARFGVYAQAGTQWEVESWGQGSTLGTSSGNAADSTAGPIVIELRGRLASTTTDTLTLRNYTVVRYPAVAAQ